MFWFEGIPERPAKELFKGQRTTSFVVLFFYKYDGVYNTKNAGILCMSGWVIESVPHNTTYERVEGGASETTAHVGGARQKVQQARHI